MMQALSRIISGGARWVSSIISAMSRFVQGVVSGFVRVVSQVASGMGRAVSKVRSFFGKMVSAGLHIASGIAKGIANGASRVINAAANIAKKQLVQLKRTRYSLTFTCVQRYRRIYFSRFRYWYYGTKQ